MSLPTSPVDKHLPKGPNFLGIVIGFAVAIIVLLVAAWLLLGHRGFNPLPVKTKATPSQTYLAPAPLTPQPAPVA